MTITSLLPRITAACLLMAATTTVMGQGRSIPKGSQAKAQEEAETLIDEALPEGQTYRYPLLNGLSISVDLFDPVMDLMMTDNCSYEVQAMLDLHHRFFPMASFGMGYADELSDNGLDYGTSQKQEFRFKSDLAPFGKVGIAYNMRYNDVRPDDFYLLMARYGIAWNKADITNLYYADDAWGALGPIDILDQSYTTQWLELGVMLRVHIYQRFSLGWDAYWKVKLAQSGSKHGEPYFVPGMGTTASNIGFNFRIYYDIF